MSIYLIYLKSVIAADRTKRKAKRYRESNLKEKQRYLRWDM